MLSLLPLARASSSEGFALRILVALTSGFILLASLSLLAFSRAIPWMRAELKLFDVASEANLWTWANVAVLVSAANVQLACAFLARHGNRSLYYGWLASSALLLALSLDDLVGLHERLEAVGYLLGGGSGLLHFAWVIPGLGIAAAAGLVFLRLIMQLRGWPRVWLTSGASLFFFGAIALEASSGWVFTLYGPSAQYVLTFHIEEMAEAIGASLMLCAGLPHLFIATQLDRSTPGAETSLADEGMSP